HTRFSRDWSSDVCSSDLDDAGDVRHEEARHRRPARRVRERVTVMAVLSARNIAVSLDGYMAGPNQSVDAGLGEGGEQLHEWVFRSEERRAGKAVETKGPE